MKGVSEKKKTAMSYSNKQRMNMSLFSYELALVLEMSSFFCLACSPFLVFLLFCVTFTFLEYCLIMLHLCFYLGTRLAFSRFHVTNPWCSSLSRTGGKQHGSLGMLHWF